VSGDQLAALGAFFSGIGSVLSAAWYVRRQKKTAESECDKRIRQIHDSFFEGLEVGREDHPAE